MTKRDVLHPDIEGISNGVVMATSLEVSLGSNHKSLLLVIRAAGQNADVTTYALSPPAAARLARDLKKVVDEYLYGASDEETG